MRDIFFPQRKNPLDIVLETRTTDLNLPKAVSFTGDIIVEVTLLTELVPFSLELSPTSVSSSELSMRVCEAALCLVLVAMIPH